MGDRAISMLIALVVSAAIARYLGPNVFGRLSFVLALFGLLGFLSSLGLDQILVKTLSEKSAPEKAILGTAVAMRLAGTTVVSMCVLGLVYYLRPADKEAHAMAAVLILGQLASPMMVLDSWFLAHECVRRSVIVKNVIAISAALTNVGLLVARAPVLAFVWVMALSPLLIGAGLMSSFRLADRRAATHSRWSVSRQIAMKLAGTCWPLIVSGAGIAVYMKIDQVMLGQMLGNRAAGEYAAAAKLSEVWYVIPTAICTCSIPALVSARTHSIAHFEIAMRRLLTWAVWSAFLLAVPISLAASPIAHVVFGNRYQGVGPILSVHIWSSVFVFLGVASAQWFLHERQLIAHMSFTLLGAAVNVLLNLWLIPAAGGVGAAYATVASYACAAWLANLILPNTRSLFRLQVLAFLFPRGAQ